MIKMPKATLTFSIPEETEEFKDAVHVQDYKNVISAVEENIFRPARKHGYSDKNIQELINAIDDLIKNTQFGEFSKHPKDSYGPLNATDLIAMLEQKYYLHKREILEQE
jgi:hypothetical protein